MTIKNYAGTPKTLEEAINNGITFGAMLRFHEKILYTKMHTRDFIAQKFTAALMRAQTPEEEARLKHLFEEITR